MNAIIQAKITTKHRVELGADDLRAALDLPATAALSIVPDPNGSGAFRVVADWQSAADVVVLAAPPVVAPPPRTRTRSAAVAPVAPPAETPAQDDTL
jgi:hypothetical protein